MSVVKKCFKLLKLRQHFKWIPEREVVAYLRNWNLKLKSDNFGNLYLINPGTPLICAHMDTVQREDSVARLWTLRLKNWIIKADNAVIGWDDKCWIAIAMEMYEKLWDKISLLFTRQEETGCNWAREFCTNHRDLVAQCTYCLVLDRRGSWDIIWYDNSYCSKEFQDEIARLMKEFWYKPERGLCSDTGHIAKIINWVNLSVWYYNPHTKTEYINCNDLVNAYEAAMYVVQHMQWEYPIYEYKYKRYDYWNHIALWLFDDDDEDTDDRYWFSENGRTYFWWWRSNLYKYKNKNKSKTENKNKNKSTVNPLEKFIEVTKDWTVIFKQEVWLANVDDESDWVVIGKGEYDVIEANEE